MFIFCSSSGPHDPVQHHTHTLRDEPIHLHPHSVAQNTSALCSAHGHLCVSALSPKLLPSQSVCSTGPSVRRDSEVDQWGVGVSDLSLLVLLASYPHCSSSPPSGKLMRSRVPGPSAWTLHIQLKKTLNFHL